MTKVRLALTDMARGLESVDTSDVSHRALAPPQEGSEKPTEK